MSPTSNKVALTLLLLGSCILAAPLYAQDASAPAEASANWELKGLHLGASMDDVRAAMPEVKCDTESFDPGLSTCTDWKNTLGGEHAIVIVKFLDGRAVFISVENITNDQAQAAAAALTRKFGNATSVQAVNGWFLRGSRRVSDTADRSEWRQGDTVILVDPFAWTDSKKRITYSAVILMDEALHEREWIVRYNNRGKLIGDI